MKNLPKEKRDQLILCLIGTIAVTAGLWYGLISTMRQGVEVMNKQNDEKKTKVVNAQRLVNSTSDLQKGLEQATAKLAVIEESMAAGDMYSWIILRVNKFREDRKVEIPQFSREVRTEVGMFPKFPYKAAVFTVRGSAFYHDLGKFIADFENAFPHTYLQNIELEPASNTSANSASGAHPELLTFKMEIVTLINPNSL
jgi:Tfp pilus assembly protein PilO